MMSTFPCVKVSVMMTSLLIIAALDSKLFLVLPAVVAFSIPSPVKQQRRIFLDMASTAASSSTSTSQSNSESPSVLCTGKLPLHLSDPDMAALISKEDERQRIGLELIASENFASAAVREALGSCLTNKYSEGMVGKRYYGGNTFIDAIETLCMDRALSLYGLSDTEWGVNVQPYSGSPANFAVYTALLAPHSRIMGLDLPAGGHLTHGYQTASGKKVSATSVYFESLPYTVDADTGLVDYDDMEYRAKLFQPKLLIAGGSAYPREWDYQRMREIADNVGALLMTDMAHVSGLVAAGCVDSPFHHSDVVTTTTHKTLRGPRSGMIFAKREHMAAVNSAVFPMLQGGPHNHQIAAVAVALKEAESMDFRDYARRVVRNAQALAGALVGRHGHVLATGGTSNHLLLWDVRPLGITGSKCERVLEEVSITANKNSLMGDVSAVNPGGVRLGTPALTTRGLMEAHFENEVADFLNRGCDLAVRAQAVALERKADGNSNKKKVLMKEFVQVLETDEGIIQEMSNLKKEVEKFASQFDIPGGGLV